MQYLANEILNEQVCFRSCLVHGLGRSHLERLTSGSSPEADFGYSYGGVSFETNACRSVATAHDCLLIRDPMVERVVV